MIVDDAEVVLHNRLHWFGYLRLRHEKHRLMLMLHHFHHQGRGVLVHRYYRNGAAISNEQACASSLKYSPGGHESTCPLPPISQMTNLRQSCRCGRTCASEPRLYRVHRGSTLTPVTASTGSSSDPCIPGVTCPPTGPSDPPTTVTLPPPTAPTPAPPTAPTPAPPTAPTPAPPTAPTPAPPTAPTPAPTGCIPDPLSCNPFEDPNNPTLLPHESNCGQFYKCNLGERCLLSCPLGQHFWPAGGVCERPEVACCNPALCNTSPSQCVDDVRCPLIEDPNFPTTFPFPGNCSRFYKCDLGRRCPVDCWPGTHFSASTGRCEAPDEACCDPAVPCRGATVRSCAPDARCPLNDNPFDPTVLKHADCTRFYKCDNGQACVLECPRGQHFRQDTPTTGSCDWPDLACCDPNIPCTGPNPGVTCRPDSRCPLFDDPNNPLLLPHTSSCARFYKCTNGLACDLPCLHGHFSQACNVPAYWAYSCPNSCTNSSPYSSSYSGTNSSTYSCSYSSSNSRSYSRSYSSSNSRSYSRPTPAPLQLPVILAFPESLVHRVMLVTASTRTPISAMYLPLVLAVTLAAALTNGQQPCDPSVTCPTFNCTPHPNCPAKDPLHPVQLPHSDCTKFYKCSGGNACEQLCPIGLHYNAREQSCDWPNRACCDPSIECGLPDVPANDCVPNPNCPASSKDTILLPHVNCAKFYKCSGPFACPMDCPPLLHFNPKQNACDWPERACCDPTVPCDPCIPGPILLPASVCTKFYKCQSGRACEFDCPYGLHFNEKSMVCDWPHQACCDPTIECVPACIPGVTCP
uniref:Chitin-binding type-2 domain-containing protein n=1 Tax=Anopheles coluzzii TaxID=1518534 RepID=A0A8W7P7E8_ANOCL